MPIRLLPALLQAGGSSRYPTEAGQVRGQPARAQGPGQGTLQYSYSYEYEYRTAVIIQLNG